MKIQFTRKKMQLAIEVPTSFTLREMEIKQQRDTIFHLLYCQR